MPCSEQTKPPLAKHPAPNRGGGGGGRISTTKRLHTKIDCATTRQHAH